MTTFRLGVVSTHPIQYLAPFYRELARQPRLDVEVYYLTDFGQVPSHDQGFGTQYTWDVDLLSGYQSRYLHNRARNPSPRFWGNDCPELYELLDPKRLDGVLISGYKCYGYIQACRAAIRKSLPLLYRGESADHERRGCTKRLLRDCFLRLLYKHVASFLAIGEHTRRHYLRFGIDSQRIFSSPYAIDNERFLKERDTVLPLRETIRDQWGIPKEAIVALVAGKLIPKKAPTDVLQAAAQIVDRRLWLLFAGDGLLRSDMCDWAARHGFDNIVITGFLNQSEMARAYVAADFLILPSVYGETWGVVVNEAMLFHLPALVSDQVGSAPDLVIEGKTGFHFRAHDIPGLTARIRQLSADPMMVREMGSYAAAHVAQSYTPRIAAEGVLAACEFIARSKGPY